MAVVLIVLAIGSVLAGLVGIPQVLGGRNRIERFLEPAFEAHAIAPANLAFQVIEGRPRLRADGASAGQAGRPEGATAGQAGHEASVGAAEAASSSNAEGTELLLMALSSGIALAGIGLAAYFWLANRAAAAKIARRATGIYTLLLHKYYIDELYDTVIVQPIKQASTLVLWQGADAALIDGSVNGVGKAVQGASSALRRLQTGSIRAYAASLFLGVVLILGWYLLR